MHHHHAENKDCQQAGEPSKSGRVGAARIQTCSDDEDFAVLDLGGGYCSSSDGSDEGWRPHNDAANTYQAPRCEHPHISTTVIQVPTCWTVHAQGSLERPLSVQRATLAQRLKELQLT